jgi:hypothetical protein
MTRESRTKQFNAYPDLDQSEDLGAKRNNKRIHHEGTFFAFPFRVFASMWHRDRTVADARRAPRVRLRTFSLVLQSHGTTDLRDQRVNARDRVYDRVSYGLGNRKRVAPHT